MRRRIPTETRIRVIARLPKESEEFSSRRKISERIVPKMGVVKLYTVTRDTGLYLRSRPQSEYAIADRNIRYTSTKTPVGLPNETLPPKARPTATRNTPPTMN